MHTIDQNYIEQCISNLAFYTEKSRKYTRLVFSKEFKQARGWLNKEFKKLNLSTKIDYAGNLVGVYKSKNKAAKKIIIGSHIDTVVTGGKFDGTVGVVSGLAIIKTLIENNYKLPFDLEIYDYLGEELNDWNISCIGSRAICGILSEASLNHKNSEGDVLKDQINKLGGDSKKIGKISKDFEKVIACFELHIEQGAILEANNIDIGIVQSMPNISRHKVSISGKAGHSGTTLMNDRKDSLVTASKLIIFINKLARKYSNLDNRHFVATVGKIDVLPNYVTIIPSQVSFIIDLRVVQKNSRDKFLNDIKEAIYKLKKIDDLEISFEDLMFSPYVEMSKSVNQILIESAKELNYEFLLMDSGAGHDTAHLAKVTDATIVFIPCKGGLSHCPEEFAEIKNIKKGTEVILRSILKLQNEYT